VPHIIVVGNEKGGSGKSTTSMHVATALARMGHSVGAMDLDLRQRSFGRYVENRRAHLDHEGLSLATPVYTAIPDGDAPIEERFGSVLRSFDAADFVVIDCPGSHTRLSQLAHSLADTLVTPMNDSFVDFDLLARIDPATGRILGPSIYSQMVWEARQARADAGLKPIDWIVIRNRLGVQAMHNKRRMEDAITKLAPRIGFRVAPGFAERVVFRELFPKGLTLLDLRDVGVTALSMSNVAARQELRDLIRSLRLPGVEPRF
jgi:chromosome partitioning protein